MQDLIKDYIKASKHKLRTRHAVAESFAEVKQAFQQEIDVIKAADDKGESVIPQLDYHDIAAGKVSDDVRQEIRHRGCAIIRGVYSRKQAEAWNRQLGEYIERNRYHERAQDKAGLDNYFSQLNAGAPQIFGLYWSKPQIMARQAESMALTKRFLNSLYEVDGPTGPEFDPEHDYTYADRTRRREPGDTTLGLSPHIDAGSFERWVDPAYQKIYEAVFDGNWRDFNPWRATFRTQIREYSSPAVCSMFRTFQGWTALTPQGPSDGTLRLIPLANSIVYILLRALQDDVAEDDLCGAAPGRATGVTPQWHSDLLQGLVTIPQVEPGDTVWWHPDVIHAVGDAHLGEDYANVIYIAAAPKCAKNEAYAQKQAQQFLAGRSAPDFAAEDYEIDFEGRATLDDLTELGRRQMAL